jgi:hypothetical protein
MWSSSLLACGDVIIEGGDIFGDGVNVAARLESIAETGGICVSSRVQEDAQGKLDIVFEDIGEQQLKNIKHPVRVYRARLEKAPRLDSERKMRKPARLWLGIGASLTIFIIVLGWLLERGHNENSMRMGGARRFASRTSFV